MTIILSENLNAKSRKTILQKYSFLAKCSSHMVFFVSRDLKATAYSVLQQIIKILNLINTPTFRHTKPFHNKLQELEETGS